MSKKLDILAQLPSFNTDLLLPYVSIPAAVLESPDYEEGLSVSYTHFLSDWCEEDETGEDEAYIMPKLPTRQYMVEAITHDTLEILALKKQENVDWAVGYYHGVLAAYALFDRAYALELMCLVETLLLGVSVRISGTAWGLSSEQAAA